MFRGISPLITCCLSLGWWMPAFRRNWNAVALCQQIAENADSIIFLQIPTKKIFQSMFFLTDRGIHQPRFCTPPQLPSFSSSSLLSIHIVSSLESSNHLPDRIYDWVEECSPSRRLTRRVKVNPEWWRRRNPACWPSADEALWSKGKDSLAHLEVSFGYFGFENVSHKAQKVLHPC